LEKRKIKQIYWFAYYNLNSPSVRYRAKYPLDFARTHLDVSSRLIIPGYSPKRLLNFFLGYISALLFPGDDSLIVIQRVRSNFLYFNLLKLLVKVRKNLTVYDLDDADYLEYEPKNIHFFARNCSFIAAGSSEITTYLQQFNPNVMHVTSPTPDLGIVKQHRNKTFTIGWIGGFGWGHKDSLYDLVFPAIKNLKFDCQLTLLGITKDSDVVEIRKYFEGHSNIKIVIPREINWNDEKDLQTRISGFDVGVATLLNHPIQIAKSGIKAKQYMNNGVPVLCNDLAENNNVVIDGYNGFICNTVKDFTNNLKEFEEMDDQRYREFSRNGRNSTKNFDHHKWISDFEKIKSKMSVQIEDSAQLETSKS